MADLSKFLFVNTDNVYEESAASDSAKFASFKTANYELTDVLLGLLANAITSSAGAADAGKFIKLDAGGKLDASFIDEADIDHDDTNGAAASTVHTAFPLLAGGRNFTAVQRYDAAKTYTNDYEIVDKKYVDDTVAAVSSGSEWKNSCLDRAITPPGSPSSGDRYLIDAQLGTATGAWAGEDDEIAEWNGSAWTFSGAPSTGWKTSVDDETDGVYFYNGSQWTKQFYESTTASLGCQKVGVDIRSDLLANGGLGLSTNSLYVLTDDASVEKNPSNGQLRVKADGINDTHIDFGTGANQVSAVDLPIADAGGYTSETEVEGALQEIYGELDTLGTLEVTTDATGVTKGDLVYFSGNNIVSVYDDLTEPQAAVMIALETKGPSTAVKVVQSDKVVASVLSGATAGNKYFWNGSGWQTSMPSTTGHHVWVGFVAKNATDALTYIQYIKKNS